MFNDFNKGRCDVHKMLNTSRVDGKHVPGKPSIKIKLMKTESFTFLLIKLKDYSPKIEDNEKHRRRHKNNSS